MRFVKKTVKLRASDYSVVGPFVVGNESLRAELTRFVKQVSESAAALKHSAQPASFLIGGRSGSGKDVFVKSLLNDLRRNGSISGWFEVNLSGKELPQVFDTIIDRLRGMSVSERPVAIFVNEFDKIGDAAFGPFLQPLNVDSDWLARLQLPLEAARRTLWVFAGTFPGTADQIAERFKEKPRQTAAPDFLSRVGAKRIITLEGMFSPDQTLWRYLYSALVQDSGELWPVAPTALTAELVLKILTTTVNDGRDINREMASARAALEREGKQLLGIDDVFRTAEVAGFRIVYSDKLEELRGHVIKVEWDLKADH